MFAGGIQPRGMTANPDVFNQGQLEAPGPSAGPFIVSKIDRSAQRIVLTRNPRWWGAKPRLESITYLVLDPAAVIPALQNKDIDAADSQRSARLKPMQIVTVVDDPLDSHVLFNDFGVVSKFPAGSGRSFFWW